MSVHRLGGVRACVAIISAYNKISEGGADGTSSLRMPYRDTGGEKYANGDEVRGYMPQICRWRAAWRRELGAVCGAAEGEVGW